MRTLRIPLLILSLTVTSGAAGQQWTPAGQTLRTTWAREVNPGNLWPEYPRPIMTRAAWLNLNGLWEYAITPIDQGWWPAGLYTAPTDAALRYDLEQIKALGFNMLRKHVKVEPERLYYWADKLGLLVWQDMPSSNFNRNTVAADALAEADRQWDAELKAMIDHLHNYPSIVMWIPSQHPEIEDVG